MRLRRNVSIATWQSMERGSEEPKAPAGLGLVPGQVVRNITRPGYGDSILDAAAKHIPHLCSISR